MGKLYKMPKRKITLSVNTIYCADNLHILKTFPNESIDMIYIDPPFNTGSVRRARAWDEEVQGLEYYDSFGNGMMSYVEFMKERLQHMYRILKDDGSLLVHLDYRSVHYIKKELDIIFGQGQCDKGAKHLINEIIWCYNDPAGGKGGNFFQRKHDTILWYYKNGQRTFNLPRQQLSESTLKRYRPYFEKGKLSYRRLKETNPGVFTKLKSVPENLDEIWIDEKKGAPMTDWWDDIPPIKKKGGAQKSEYIGYPTQKPLELLERIITMCTKKNDIVADFFCGCGTTISAAQKLGRCWIGVDASKKAAQTMRKRMIRDHNLTIDESTIEKATLEKIFAMPPLEFEKTMVHYLGGVHVGNHNDNGVDGYIADTGEPIQVKQYKPSRDEFDKFYKHLKKKGEGSYIAYDFTTGIKEEVKRMKNEEGIECRLYTVGNILEIPRKEYLDKLKKHLNNKSA